MEFTYRGQIRIDKCNEKEKNREGEREMRKRKTNTYRISLLCSTVYLLQVTVPNLWNLAIPVSTKFYQHGKSIRLKVTLNITKKKLLCCTQLDISNVAKQIQLWLPPSTKYIIQLTNAEHSIYNSKHYWIKYRHLLGNVSCDRWNLYTYIKIN